MSSLSDSPRFLTSRSNGNGNGSGGTVEHCQTIIMDDNLQQHQQATATPSSSKLKKLLPLRRSSSQRSIRRNVSASSDASTPLIPKSIPTMLEYSSDEQFTFQEYQPSRNIRFQVVFWYIGQTDMIQGRVPATFRITIFWNDVDAPTNDFAEEELDTETASIGTSTRSHSQQQWQMQGRQMAIQTNINTDKENTNTTTTTPIIQHRKTVQVPAVSILNVVTFDTIGSPEISLLQEETQLYRWTCMYRATLVQDHWRVDQFPHDEHDVCLKLAILANRRAGEAWDRHFWTLGLATANDARGSIRIPHGLVVDQVAIPGFSYNQKEGLTFSFVPLNHGGRGTSKDECLQVKLKVYRDSSYYDKNIMPLLGLLNFVAISITALEAQDFFQRGLLTLNIAFVEIGIRMTTDKHLPSVTYQIKMQRILNEYFYGLLFLVWESLVVYVLKVRFFVTWTGYVDVLAACTALIHNIYTQTSYYNDAKCIKRKVLDVSSPKPTRTYHGVGGVV